MKKLVLIFILLTMVFIVNSQESLNNPVIKPQQSIVVKTDSLYKGYDYNYYEKLYKKAIKQQNVGIALTVLGGACIVGGYAIMANNYNKFLENSYTNQGNGVGFTIFVSGMVMFPIGLTNSLVGSGKKRKAYKAMGELSPQLNLSFGVTGNGMGFVLRM